METSTKKRIMVVGDIMLDKYINCEMNRISPEAPVPVLRYVEEKSVLGGAANVANNLAANNQIVSIVGVLGLDENGIKTQELLKSSNISTHLIINSEERPTTTKSRFVSMNQQAFRFDEENVSELSAKDEACIKQAIEDEIDNYDVIVISDYLKGFLTDSLTAHIINCANEHRIPVIVDPKSNNPLKYKGCTLIKPNKKEMEGFLNEKLDCVSPISLEGKVLALKEKIGCKYVLLTLGSQGMIFIDDNNRIQHIESVAREVFDVTGAGDTVLAFLALGFNGSELSFEKVELANKAAGAKVGKFGTSVVTYNDISFDVHKSNTILKFDDIKKSIDYLKSKNKKIVFTNGCFDIIHSGHIRYLKEAKKKGDILIVGLNSDDSVKRLKGNNRPIVNEEERAEVLAGLECVDYVVVFQEDTPLDLIKLIKPDILVKGGDYVVEDIVGYREVIESGGKVMTIPYVEGKSTTDIIQRIMGKDK